MEQTPNHFATRAVQGTHLPPPLERPASVPIYQSSTFAFEDADLFASTLAQPGKGYVYTRYENPTTAELEATMASLEGGVAAFATASGMGAIASVLLSLASAGDHVVAQRELYGGTYSLLTGIAARFGIETTFVDGTDAEAVRTAITDHTRVVYAETIANPTLTVADLPALAEVAHAAGIPLVVDSTVASPALCRPIEHGADVVVHSSTKFLGGHSDVVGGIAVFADTAMHHAAWKTMLDLGPSADPFAAWLVLRGIKTLEVRMQRHSANAGALAAMLDAHPKVERVRWPGLAGHATHHLARSLLDGYGGLLSFTVTGGRDAGRRVIEAVKIAKLAASLGGVETLVAHPASTTHRQIPAADLEAAGIDPGMVRVSVGIEHAEDLCEDFAGALEKA